MGDVEQIAQAAKHDPLAKLLAMIGWPDDWSGLRDGDSFPVELRATVGDLKAAHAAWSATAAASARIAELEGEMARLRAPFARLEQFEKALFSLRWAAELVMAGRQFNAYDSARNDEDDDPEDCEMIIGVGPVSDFRWFAETTGRDQAAIIEAALKFASEAMRARAALQAPSAGGEGGK